MFMHEKYFPTFMDWFHIDGSSLHVSFFTVDVEIDLLLIAFKW